MPRLQFKTGLLALALVLVTALAYWPGLTGGFLFDDYPNIVKQEAVHATELDLASLKRAAHTYGGPIGRPIATISFAVDHALWDGNAWGFKLTGILVHLLNSLLVFALARRLLQLTGTAAPTCTAGGFAIALLWAIHPLQVSTVLYVVQRMETMSLSFVLLALLAYLRGRTRQVEGQRGWPWLLACGPLVLLGLMCKESAILFPLYALALEFTVLGFAATRPAVTRFLRWSYVLGIVLALAVYFAVVVPHYLQPEIYAVRDFTLAERLLTQLRVLPMYLSWIVVPQPGSYLFYYDNFPVSQGLLQPVTTLLGALLLIALAGIAYLFRRRAPLLALGLMWFFAAHVLTSNVAHLELVFEHRNYFAILGVLLVLADLVRRMPVSNSPRLRPFTIGVLMAGFLVLTVIRSATWGNPLTLAMELAAKNPGSPRASTDLGEQFMIRAGNDPSSRFYQMAEQEFERGSRVPNASAMPEQGLIVLSGAAGQPAKPEWWDRIVHKLETRAIGPQELSMITGLLQMRSEGLVFDDGRFADAYLVLSNRMQMPPGQYYAFGEHALRYLKDEKLANQLFQRAVDHSVEQPEFAAAMADALLKGGYPRQAQVVADHAREIGLAEFDLPAQSAAAVEPGASPTEGGD